MPITSASPPLSGGKGAGAGNRGKRKRKRAPVGRHHGGTAAGAALPRARRWREGDAEAAELLPVPQALGGRRVRGAGRPRTRHLPGVLPARARYGRAGGAAWPPRGTILWVGEGSPPPFSRGFIAPPTPADKKRVESRADHVLELGGKVLKVILQPLEGARSKSPAVVQADRGQAQHLSPPGSAELRTAQGHRDGAAEMLTKKVHRGEPCGAAPLCRRCAVRQGGNAECFIVLLSIMVQCVGAQLTRGGFVNTAGSNFGVLCHNPSARQRKARSLAWFWHCHVWHSKDCSQW